MLRPIVLLILTALCSQIWAYTLTTTGQSYDQDAGEYFYIGHSIDSEAQNSNYDINGYFYIDRNTEPEGQKPAYDSRLNLSKPVEYLQTESTDTKPQLGAFFAFIGDIVVTKSVNDFKYAPRVRARGVEDPKSHNFPYSFDKEILKTTPDVKSSGYQIFRKEGTMTGKTVTDPVTGVRTQQYKDGVFEIGVRKDGVIDHRFFRPND